METTFKLTIAAALVLLIVVIVLTVILSTNKNCPSVEGKYKRKGGSRAALESASIQEQTKFNHDWYRLDQRWLGEYKLKTLHSHQIRMKKTFFDMAMKLPQGATVMDCGAHIGDTGLFLKTQFVKNRRSDINVVSVEPDTSKAEFIKGMAKSEGVDIRVVNAGLWDKETRGRVVRDEDYSAMWKVKEDPRGDTVFTTLDAVFSGDRLDILQLDVEGSEPQALRGGEKTITTFHPAIFLEVEERDGKDRTSKEAIAILTGWGYRREGPRMDNDLLFIHSG
jgi:FkbM family methyltransferase